MTEYIVTETGFTGHIVKARNKREALRKYKKKYKIVNPKQVSIREK